MQHDIASILREIPQLSGTPVVAPLAGGITNYNYRVEAGGEVYVLRVAGANTAQLGIDRDREFACATAAAAAGVGAEVIAYLPHHRALLSRFVEGKILAVGDVASGEVLARAVRALVQLHTSAVVPAEFSVFAVVQDYYRLAVERGAQFPPQLQQTVEHELESLRSAATSATLCPCHNDLLPANLIDDGSVVRVIDWEYAGMGDPFFDLGNFAENHLLTSDQEMELLRHYFGVVRLNDARRLQAMRKMSALREALWGYVQASISQLDFDFRGYAGHHWQRFLARSSVL